MFKSDMNLVLVIFVFYFRIIFGNTLNDLEIPIHLEDDLNRNDDFVAPKEEIQLEDFFWTGSGDGPPDYIKNVHTGISRGNNVIVKTETVVATVYVDGNNDIYNNQPPTCIDCTNNGLPINYTTTDRRYWLLTVISGYFQQNDYILLEDKLAQLYRLAFTRQQSKHLGIEEENRKKNENLSIREKRQTNSLQIDNPTMDRILNINETDIDNNHIKNSKFNNTNTTTISTMISTSPTTLQITHSSSISNKSKENYKIDSNSNQKNYQPSSFTDVTDKNFPDTKSIYTEQQVQIFIHNVTLLTEDDIENWEDHSFEQDINDKRDSRPLANQTEIIYSVFVNGKPVLATTAAEDMKLLSENEVSSIMGKIVFMKAEPYLKEPQATPLIPASKSGQEPSFLAYIQDNPVLIVISSVAMMLVLILLLALLLMTRAKRDRSAEVKRLSSRHGLLSSHQQSSQGFDTGRTDRPSTVESHDIDGIQNYGYEHDKTTHKRPDGRPHISFPLPPAGSRPGSSSTVSTSDSSVYCPVNRPNIDLQHMLDEKAAKLFDKKRKTSTKIGHIGNESNKNIEPIYTSVINGGGGARKRDKKSKQKHRRRYLQENRVGSIDELDIHSSAETSLSTDDNISDSFKPDYENFESNEAYNLHNNYHRNKILQNRVFTDKIYDTVHEDIMTPTEAINREIIKALQPTEKSSENGSIGSFLSMASVKSFPKSTLPEPLHRVLEPVSVTYYDHYDEPIPKSSHKQQHSSQQPYQTSTTIEKSRDSDRKVDKKRDGDGEHKIVQTASQSDNPDPGVLGPIVWEIHKKKLTRNESLDSPLHDPAATRNRYEDLLEGAIQMYDDHTPPTIKQSKNPIDSRICSGNNRNLSKENRGKSAIVSSSTERLQKSDIDCRPFTAGPDKTIQSNQSTQPPSPNFAAWTNNSGTASPLVRPLSAGPFHRPPPPIVDITRILASQSADRGQLSAAPLIEAIQNELQKFKRDNSQ